LLPKLLIEELVVATPEGRVSLTDRGRLVADSVGAEILEAFESSAKVSVE
jgi:oxygen-independent coproporphyrinogen-3 oxidase